MEKKYLIQKKFTHCQYVILHAVVNNGKTFDGVTVPASGNESLCLLV